MLARTIGFNLLAFRSNSLAIALILSNISRSRRLEYRVEINRRLPCDALMPFGVKATQLADAALNGLDRQKASPNLTLVAKSL